MKTVFNASILAAAVALSFGANAADLSVANPTVISAEAAAAGHTAGAQAQTIRTITREELIPGDKVTFTFPKGTSFTVGTAQVVPTNTGIDFLDIDYGNGTFTFTNVAWTAETPTAAATLTMEVELGNPVINNSAYDINFAVAGDFTPGAGNVTYVAVDGVSGDVKDTGGNNSAPLTATSAQEVSSVSKKFDGYINRDNRNLFNNKGNLVAEVSVSQPANTIVAVPAAGKDQLVVTATKGLNDLASVQVSNCSDTTVANGAACVVTPGNAVVQTVLAAAFTCSTDALNPKCVKDTATFDVSTLTAALPAAVLPATGKAGKFYVSVAPGVVADDALPVTDLTMSRTVEYTKAGAVTVNPTFKYFEASDAGQFQLDATVVNVPYLPVGFGLSPNVEIANDSAAGTEAEIIIEGFSQGATPGEAGVSYGPVTLSAKAPGKTVTKVSEADIKAAFGITDKRKLSVTFVIDADASDITLAPYYRQNESRVNVMSDQYKGQ